MGVTFQWLLFIAVLAQTGVTLFLWSRFRTLRTKATRARSQAIMARKKIEIAQRISRVATWEFNLLTGQVTWSANMPELYGYALGTDEAAFSVERWLEVIHPEDRLAASSTTEKAISTHQNYELKYRVITPQAGIRWLFAKAEVMVDESGRAVQIYGINIDITDAYERRNSEKELLRSQRELLSAKDAADSANRAKSEFLANMSHEIRTPLGAILGFAELLTAADQTEADRENYMSAIRRNGEQLSKIIDEILDISKVEAGKLEVERIDLNLTSFLSDINTLLNIRAQEKGILLFFKTEGPVPEHILADATKLRQILLNVIGNAIKFTDKGRVVVTMRVSGNPEVDAGFLHFLVRDTGPGLTPEQCERLFQPFAQADSSTRRKYGGTGLGLVLSRRLSELLGGGLELLKSEPRRGSEFEITIALPRNEIAYEFTQLETPHLEQPHSKQPLVVPGTEVSLSGVRVLVVDDAPDNRLLVNRYLKRAGAAVDFAENGLEGTRKALTGVFDIVIMDIQMPLYDGLEATGELRRRGYTKPIIALSAHAMKEDRERSFNAGCNEHLTKPVDRLALLKRISTFVGNEKTNSV